jgi:malate dehydrogenase (oxaloacetate-decarboxylating)(NADP+)
MKLLVSMGAKVENIFMVDRTGVIHAGRDDLNQYKAQFAHATDKRTLADALDGADVFVGLSGPNLLSAEGLKSMAPTRSCSPAPTRTRKSRRNWHTPPAAT